VNAHDILRYGHADVLRAFDKLSERDWNEVGVTSRWTPKDLLSHLTSYELMLEDALKSVLGRSPTPTLDASSSDRGGFNDQQVGARRDHLPDQVLREYVEAHDRVVALADELGAERLRQPGTIPWYGDGYSLDDFIVYTNYAHKREHCAQLKQFRMRQKI
jgi:hypothetical protein